MAKSVRVKDVFTGRKGLLDDSEFNSLMRQWATEVQRDAKQKASSFTKGKRHSPRVYKSGPKKGSIEHHLRSHISFLLKSDAGEVAAVAFKFPVHGIFREYGVGRSHPRSMANRSLSDWMSGSLQRKEEKLLTIVAEHEGDKYIKTFMGIKK